MKIPFSFFFIALFLASFVLAQANETNFSTPIDTAIFNSEVSLPEWLQNISHIAFKIEGEVKLSDFILLALIFIICISMIYEVLLSLPFFPGTVTRLIATLAISGLISLSGALNSLKIFYLGTADYFKFLEGWTAGKIIFSLILLFITAAIIHVILQSIRNYTGLANAEESGMKAGLGLKILEDIASIWSK